MNQTAQQWLTLRKAEYQRLNTELITHACQFVDLVDAQKLPQGLQMADELLVLNCDNQTLDGRYHLSKYLSSTTSIRFD